ncbi:MAG: 2Fe-2S iron-sulfur cluster-binding protein [Alcaligenaceae bacterium]
MKLVTLLINGKSIQKAVSDRTHLGDFLRDTVQLTGTHLGCEHGVCGACTVLLDGMPIRSCITYAVACEGRTITTIEGYAADPVMSRLRTAFTAHHALQCGYCTPGMLATARDIVLRLPEADENRVRIELAGNLCRCTGYMGIVSAILAVLTELREQPDPVVQKLRDETAQGVTVSVASSVAAQAFTSFEAKRIVSDVASASASASENNMQEGKGTRVNASFEVPFAVEVVWSFMSDLKAVAGCLPGAQIDAQTPERVEGYIAIKFGPMAAKFKGNATIERDELKRSATLRGTGQDSLSQSRATGDVRYQLMALEVARTQVSVDLTYTLQGPLAQFSRSGLVQEFVRRMVADFGKNVTQRLQNPGASDPIASESMNPVRVLLSIIWSKIKRFFSA